MSDQQATIQQEEAPQPDSASPSTLDHPWRLFAIMTIAGIVIENLLHGQPPALGFSVAALVTLGVVVGVARLYQIRLEVSHWALMGATLFFALMVGVRASDSLKAFNILAVLSLLLLIAYLYAQGDRRQLSVGSLVIGLVAAAFAAMFAPIAFFFNDLSQERLRISGQSGWVLVGIAIALPVLGLFSALFASADAVFAQVLRNLWRWDLASIFTHGILAGFIVWLGLGIMRFALTHAFSPERVDQALGQRSIGLGLIEIGTVLVLVNLLFLTFVAIQFAYLFGGLDTLAQTGLTFSEYARRGFFELVAVAALVIVLVLGADWLARRHVDRSMRWVDGLLALLLVLTGIVLVSALQRMRLYVGAFGLTELRFYTTAAMIWIGFTVIWAGVTLLRSRRLSFVPGVVLAAILLLAGANLLNPDAVIARYNLTAQTAESALDVPYLTAQLSDDAVPTLIAYLPSLAPKEQLLLRSTLGDRLIRLNQESWRTWRGTDWGTLRARRALAAFFSAL